MFKCHAERSDESLVRSNGSRVATQKVLPLGLRQASVVNGSLKRYFEISPMRSI